MIFHRMWNILNDHLGFSESNSMQSHNEPDSVSLSTAGEAMVEPFLVVDSHAGIFVRVKRTQALVLILPQRFQRSLDVVLYQSWQQNRISVPTATEVWRTQDEPSVAELEANIGFLSLEKTVAQNQESNSEDQQVQASHVTARCRQTPWPWSASQTSIGHASPRASPQQHRQQMQLCLRSSRPPHHHSQYHHP